MRHEQIKQALEKIPTDAFCTLKKEGVISPSLLRAIEVCERYYSLRATMSYTEAITTIADESNMPESSVKSIIRRIG